MADDAIRALQTLIAEAKVLAGAPHPCGVLGHRWRHVGGRNCGCEGADDEGNKWRGSCSVPVYKCDACGDYDYGHNAEAAEILRGCEAREAARDAG